MSTPLPVLILGAGGHGRVLAEALLASGRQVLGFLDDAADTAPHGLPLLGRFEAALSRDPASLELVNAVGSVRDMTVRRSVFTRFADRGFRFAAVVHPSAVVASDARLGRGAQVLAGAVVGSGAEVGANSIVNTGARVDHDCRIGDHVHLAPGAILSGDVAVGGSTHVGAGACVIQGLRIGEGCLIGAGAAVVRDVPDGHIALGVPARNRILAGRELRVGVLVQARTGSVRFPGKVLHPVCGKPMLLYLLESLDRCAEADLTACLTSDDPSDDALADLLRGLGRTVVRGPLEDVAGRFRLACGLLGLDAFCRVSGDSPLFDWRLADRAIARFRLERPDLCTNILTRTFPKGQSVEVVDVRAFLRACEAMTTPREREHVTPFFYDRPDAFRIASFESGRDAGAVRLCVDTAEDMARFEALLGRLPRPHWKNGWEDVLAACGPASAGA